MAQAAAVTELVETKQKQLTRTLAGATTAQVAASGQQVGAIERVAIASRGESAVQTASTTTLRTNTAAREQATVAARAQQAATSSLTSANSMLGASMTPLTKGLGALALGLGYAGYRGMEFDSAMSVVRASTGETGAGLEDLRNLAVDLGSQTK